jgi:hypothetical protein
MMLSCEFTAEGIQDLQLIPSYLNDHCEPEVVEPGSDRYERVIDVVTRLSRSIGTEVGVKDGIMRLDLDHSKEVDTLRLLQRQRISYPSLRYLSTLDV